MVREAAAVFVAGGIAVAAFEAAQLGFGLRIAAGFGAWVALLPTGWTTSAMGSLVAERTALAVAAAWARSATSAIAGSCSPDRLAAQRDSGTDSSSSRLAAPTAILAFLEEAVSPLAAVLIPGLPKDR